MHHFIAIGEFRFELQSGNAQIGSNLTIFLPSVTLKFHGWPWTRQIWGIWKLRPAYSLQAPNLGQNRWCFVLCDLDIWWMTLETIGHLSFVVSSFVQHSIAIGEFKLELQSGNAQFGSNSTIFLAVWPWNLTAVWPWKTIGHLFYATSSFVHHFIAIGELKLQLQSGNAQFGSNLTIFRAMWPWNLSDDLEKQ